MIESLGRKTSASSVKPLSSDSEPGSIGLI